MRLSMWLLIIVGVFAGALPAYSVGVYFAGGLTSFGDLVTNYTLYPWGIVWKDREGLGTSYWLGGGVVVPAWGHAGVVTPSLELVTDVGFSAQKKVGKSETYDGEELSWKLIPIREDLVFGITFGAAPFKPFIGFGGGVAIAPWTLTDVESGLEVDKNTEVKAAFDIPFGCEFLLSPNFTLAVRAEQLVITGSVTPRVTVEGVDTAMPDPFLFMAVAQAKF